MLIPVTYMSLDAPPAALSRSLADLGVRANIERLDADAFLELYGAVGAPWGWDQRRGMPREALAAHLAGPASRVYVLRNDAPDGAELGLCELDLSEARAPEIVNFGLRPEEIGRGLGLPFLCHVLCDVWAALTPDRIWLHTDVMDHPKAIETYRHAGFTIDRVVMEDAAEL